MNWHHIWAGTRKIKPSAGPGWKAQSSPSTMFKRCRWSCNGCKDWAALPSMLTEGL
ncbi:unnamed protein product, partial [Bubo scandiacus]